MISFYYKYFFRSLLRWVGVRIAADPIELQIMKIQHRITDKQIANAIEPRVTQQAVNKALHGNLKVLLPKIESAIQIILFKSNTRQKTGRVIR